MFSGETAFARIGRFVLFSLALSAGGCGKEVGPALVTVTGTVTLDGKPLQNGIIRFLPDNARGNNGPIASSTLDDKGRYSLVSPGERVGVVPGFHLVTVICDELPVHEVSPGVFKNATHPCVVPLHYADEKQSQLTAEVQDEEADVLDFDLKSTR